MSKHPKAIEFKAGTLTAMTALVRELDPSRLGKALNTLLGAMDNYFDDELAVIDLAQVTAIPAQVDWVAISTLLRGYGLQPVAVKNVPDNLLESVRLAGFAVLAKQVAVAAGELSPAPQPATAVAEAGSPPAALAVAPAVLATKVIDRPVRSGQQIYARGGDLILLNGVSPGAEVIADGSIHCYGPLRGRAVAGAQGNTSARIFCSNFGPELISIAGVYRNFEGGIAPTLAAKPAQALLRATADAGAEQLILIIEPLQLG